MQVAAVVLLVGCFAHQVSHSLGGKTTSLPKDFTLCKIGDDDCLLTAINKAIQLLKNGNPKIGALPLDPLPVSEMILNQGSGPVNINLVFKNLNVMGLGDLILNSAKGEFTDKTYNLVLRGKSPAIILYGDYTVDGKVLILPIRGAGKENITVVDADLTVTIVGHVIEKEGVEYVNIDSLELTYTTSRLLMYFGNLFDGDKALGDGMNTFLNENWKDILQELQPATEQALGNVLKVVVSRLYEKVPYRKTHIKE